MNVIIAVILAIVMAAITLLILEALGLREVFAACAALLVFVVVLLGVPRYGRLP